MTRDCDNLSQPIDEFKISLNLVSGRTTRREVLRAALVSTPTWLLSSHALSQVKTVSDQGSRLRVGGVGSATPVLKRLAAMHESRHPGVRIELVDPPLGSSGALRALASGHLDVAVAGRALSSQERGIAIPWVRTPLVLASSDATTPGLTLEQIADAFSGRLSMWPDGRPVRLVLRSAFESETLQLKAMSPNVARAVDLALQRRDLPIAENDLAALSTISRLSGSLGSSSLGLVLSTQARVRVLSINGREPTLAHLVSGAYPWSRAYWLVHAAEPSSSVRAFVATLKSEAAIQSLQSIGYAPAA